jgi:hypothetical protein
MKNTIISIGTLIICYLTTAFIKADIDFTNWTQENRVGFIMFYFCSVALINIFYEIFKADNQ